MRPETLKLRNTGREFPENLARDIGLTDLAGKKYTDSGQLAVAATKLLKARELACVLMYYRDKKTMEMIGKKYSMTKANVSLVLRKAVRKLRAAAASCTGPAAGKTEVRKAERVLYTAYRQKGGVQQAVYENSTATLQEKESFRSQLISAGLSPRSANVLIRDGITDWQTLRQLSGDELLSRKNIGKKTISEIISVKEDMDVPRTEVV